MAWKTADLTGAAFVGKLPPLDRVLAKRTTDQQSFEQMKAQIEQLSRITGFPMRTVES